MAALEFSLALDKIEIFILTMEKIHAVLPILVGETIVSLKPAVRQFGIIIDTTMSFFE